MKIHHLNCGTMCPWGGFVMDGDTPSLGSSHLVCHCLLLETTSGLVLVDTGFGLEDVYRPRSRLSSFLLRLNRPKLKESETAVWQIERLGFRKRDVQHIVLTHLDFDHAGGISDFPNARVHLLGDEYRSAHRIRRFIDTARYRPAQWDRERQWQLYEPAGDRWFGFQCVRELKGLPPDILLVPLIGHSWGHCGVAVRTSEGHWLLHAGDAYFYRHEMSVLDPRCTPGLALYQRMMEVDRESRLWNQSRLRDLIDAHGRDVRVFSAHDHKELEWAMEIDRRDARRRASGAAERPRLRNEKTIPRNL